MRTIEIRFFGDDPHALATVTHDGGTGPAVIRDVADDETRDHLLHHVRRRPSMQVVLPSAGAAYMDALFEEFSGSYVRAVEVEA